MLGLNRIKINTTPLEAWTGSQWQELNHGTRLASYEDLRRLVFRSRPSQTLNGSHLVILTSHLRRRGARSRTPAITAHRIRSMLILQLHTRSDGRRHDCLLMPLTQRAATTVIIKIPELRLSLNGRPSVVFQRHHRTCCEPYRTPAFRVTLTHLV